MDRRRGGGDRYGNDSTNDSHSYRYPRGGGGGGSGPPPYRSSGDYSINRNRGGFCGNRRPLESSPPRYSLSGGGEFRPVDGDGGFRPMGGRGARNYNNSSSEFEVPLSGQKRFNSDYEVPISGQKRHFPFPDRVGASPPDHFDGGSLNKKNFDRGNFDKKHVDGGSFAKLFVGSVPKTATEEDIRPVFEEHGDVLEVALIKDKRTGQQQGHTPFASAGCCFIKYATSEDADRAIRALHNQYTLPGGVGPIQVRYADGERERLGAVEYKLFVGSLNRQATEKEVEDIFLPYGRVEDVYLMRDEMKHSRGCGFVKFSNRDAAMAAINALNGLYTMRGCEQPLIVRFADPKRTRPGETRGAPATGGPGFGPRVQSPGLRPPPNLGEAMHAPIPSNARHPMNQQTMVPPSDVGIYGFGSQMSPSLGDRTMSSAQAGAYGCLGATPDGSFPGVAVPATSAQQRFNPSLSQFPSGGNKLSPLEKPNEPQQDFSLSLQLHPPTQAMYSQAPKSTAVRPPGQLQAPMSAAQASFSQGFPSQPMLSSCDQIPVLYPQAQGQAQAGVSSATTLALSDSSLPSNVLSAMSNQYQLPGQQQVLQPVHQSASPLAQMLSQQKQTLQASYQSSQQAFSQLQQQLQLMQPSNQSLALQQNLQAAKMQSPWAVSTPQATVTSSSPSVKPLADSLPATSTASFAPVMSSVVASLKCNWTEHTSPDGYKYYYNSTTGESRWEKPEELALIEQQQKPQEQQQLQNASVRQPQSQSHPQRLSNQQTPQASQLQPQNHLQTQMQMLVRHPQQLQQASQSSAYHAAGVAGHQNIQGFSHNTQLAATGSLMNEPPRFQQRFHAAQDLMWKNKPAGS